ncbi:hypothetical protein SLS62_005868 [Diatrype stigma]|uniref:Uncharacterized protein n=1 Tax=Diatrype stigma TaxID=117547 RepID=A0AAN9UND7_9PEZI
MFGGLSTIIQSSAQLGPPPTDVPPPTSIRLPQCNPSLSREADATVTKSLPPQDRNLDRSLVRLLQTVHRPNDLTDLHFAALGVHVHADAPAEDLLPDPSYFPAAAGWDGLTIDEARERDPTFRRPLSNGHISPDARIYVERRNELSTPNQAAFRTVRRLRPELGKPLARLGNCYEFFKQLELMASYWDDTSLPPPTEGGDGDDNDGDGGAGQQRGGGAPPAGSPSGTTISEQAGSLGGGVSAAPESNARSQPAPDGGPSQTQTPERVTYRRQPGSEMPPEYRHNLVAAFVKLVAYDFGCSVWPSRVEPRLHLLEPPQPPPITMNNPLSRLKGPAPPPPPQRASYFPSGCVFVQRIPTTREAARAGIVEGPVAAVSARNATSFASSPANGAEARVDFGRELAAALATAQLRARQGKEERRFGEGKWWATAKRWGGGEGGPIGREVESTSSSGSGAGDNKDASAAAGRKPESEPGSGSSAGTGADGKSSSSGAATPTVSHAAKIAAAIGGTGAGSGSTGGVRPIPVRGQPASKKQRKTPTIYDQYRMVRPPTSNWDRKARYEAIGREPSDGNGSGHDDVFIFSSLFHHFCIVRVRVPDRLLAVLDGAPPEPEEGENENGIGNGTDCKRSWGKLEVWRSRWFDLFLVEDRLEAMRELWGVMAWLMRRQQKQDEEKKVKEEEKNSDNSSSSKDVTMADT